MTPLCECGCGQPVKWNKLKKEWNKYLQHHHKRSKSYLKSKEAQLCECG